MNDVNLRDSDISRAARYLIGRHGHDARRVANKRAQDLWINNHFQAARIWDRIALAIGTLETQQQRISSESVVAD